MSCKLAIRFSTFLIFILSGKNGKLLWSFCNLSRYWTSTSRKYPAGTQYSGNICWVFPQRWNVQDIRGTFREHFEGKYSLKISQWKSYFCVKNVWFIMTNVDLLPNSSNNKVVFPEDSRNISRMSVSKIFHGFPRSKVLKIFLEVKKFKKLFCGLSCDNVDIGILLFYNVYLDFIETVLHLE